ncbi:allantoate permease [Dactylonectria estremocensis]|uniref:Allantoate permease n=1 Tax=Dactylonectria estremocensis TaxID=1079267 RepID=A0A9P9EZP3_9HYPO|nr:allantoate permease [Dactylonectria estremocensis]
MELKNTAQLHGVSQTDSDPKLGDADVALKFRSEVENLSITDEQYRRVLRKIDTRLLPLLVVTGFLQYLDKQAIQYAVLYNLRDDLKLVGNQYSWANSIFYFGWLVWQYPSLLMLQRFPVGKYFASQVFGWGVFSFLIATSTNFAGISALRFLLGCAECIQLAAFAIITNMYYTRREQPLRLLCWYAMNGFATIVGSLFAYGIGHINSSVPLWKFPFLICGAISTAWSICLWFLLPSNPTEAWFLSKEERIIALARVKDNQNGVEAKVFKKEQAIEALKDPKVWLNAIGTGSGNILGGVSAFMALIIRMFGFSTLQTTLLSLPVGVIQLVMLSIFSVLATYIPNSRLSWALLADGISLAGACMLYAIDPSNRWAVLSGFWLMVGFIPCSFILAFGTMSANIGGHTKKITSQAIFFVLYSVGNIIGPQLYTTPPYSQGLRANVVALAICAATNIASMFYLRWENAKRHKYLDAHRDQLDELDFAFHDYSDKKNPFCFNVL